MRRIIGGLVTICAMLLVANGMSPNIFSGEIAYLGQPNAISSGEIAYLGQPKAISSGEIAYTGQLNAISNGEIVYIGGISSGEIAYLGQRNAISFGEIPSVGLFPGQIPKTVSSKNITGLTDQTKQKNAIVPQKNIVNQSINNTVPQNISA